jgi:hypothetical protein
VVDHKARRRAEAAWPEPFAIAISRENHEIGVLRGGDDLTFDPPPSRLDRRRATEPLLGFAEQSPGSLLGDRVQLLWDWGWRWVAPQQTTARRAGGGFGLGAGDMQQRDLDVVGQQLLGGVNRGLPGVFDDSDERAHSGVRP